MKYISLFSLLLAVVLIGCQREPVSADKRVITVTIEPQRFFTEQLAGDKFTIRCMVSDGNSPETYDPTPQQLVGLAQSEAYFRIGLIGFELSWMDKLKANAPQMKVFDVSEGVDFISDEAHSHEARDGHAVGADPHIWNSPANARIIARNMCRALCQLDSANQNFFQARLDSLELLINHTDSLVRALLSDVPGRSFVIYHPALTYYAHDYGLRQYCIEDHGKEPSPAHLQQLIDFCRKEKIRVVFVQKEFDSRNAELIAREIGARVVTINPLNYHWDDELIRITKILTEQP